MSPTALALVITGALLHAVWNLLAKRVAGGVAFVWLFGLVSLAAALPLGVLLGLQHWQHMRQAASATGLSETGASLGLSWGGGLAVLASGLVHVVYSLVLQRGYRVGDFSVVYPLARGTGPLFAVLGSIVMLREAPTLAGWAGIAAILSGILLLSGAWGWRKLARASSDTLASLRRGVLWGVLTGLTIAAYTLIDGWAVKVALVPPLLYYGLVLCLRALLLAPQALRQPAALRQCWHTWWREIVAVGLLSPLAYALVLQAMTQAPLSYVAPVRELSMLIGVLLGARWLRETLSPARLLGVVCMLLGVTLLAVAG